MILGANAASLFDLNPQDAFVQTRGDNLERLKPENSARNYFNGALGYITP